MFEFSLRQVALCGQQPWEVPGELAEPPSDLAAVIGTNGDQFRDSFTRLCLYLARTYDDAPQTRTDDTVVIGTEYGNTEALTRLQLGALADGKMLSAKHFPNATSSSASAFVNIGIGATGRNLTLNAGLLTPVIAIWQALYALAADRSSTSKVLVGDVYSAEALLDAKREANGLRCRSGLTHATFVKGREFRAEFDFTADHDAVVALGAQIGSDWSIDRNGAFVTAEFLDVIQKLDVGEQSVLTCRGPLARRGALTVTRQNFDTVGNGGLGE
ncbi:hypothetical protein [Catellatospora chokoriensis]|uniref:Uncharacterized protein n=1 Tax=Catellatospora chokoriensis TaxID=310353 RepID=A0A8J3NS80_9ACTN|nr:hypothetical protein [Catellatospora chokoriensis]GIF90208.1 hypothetical protein Cch02nite_36520 [Catellatospora chokoriensis]